MNGALKRNELLFELCDTDQLIRCFRVQAVPRNLGKRLADTAGDMHECRVIGIGIVFAGTGR